MSLADALPWVADALVVLGVLVVTVGVYGMIRMPDTFMRLHTASKVVFLGLIPLLAASTATGNPDIVLWVILIADPDRGVLAPDHAGRRARYRASRLPAGREDKGPRSRRRVAARPALEGSKRRRESGRALASTSPASGLL
jgi:hypothetical protein